MKHRAELPVTDEAEILRRLRDLSSWAEWWPNVVSVKGDEVRLAFNVPRPFALVVAVTSFEQGVRYSLVEGDVSVAAGEVRIDHGAIQWDLDLELPLVVPPSLALEVGQRMQPLLARLVAASSSPGGREGSDQPVC